MRLSVAVYRVNGQDCTIDGITSKNDRLVLVWDEDGECNPENTVKLVRRNIPTRSGNPYLTAYPVNEDGTPRTGGMFGGNYIKTSDSRFPSDYPIPVHDRFESAELSERLSR